MKKRKLTTDVVYFRECDSLIVSGREIMCVSVFLLVLVIEIMSDSDIILFLDSDKESVVFSVIVCE